jgi:hypothetical protein
MVKDLTRPILQAGVARNYWYPLEQVRNLEPKGVQKVFFWDEPIALFKTSNGEIRAVEDRCAHRHVSLADHGEVRADRLVCGYHGWAYDGCGKCSNIPGGSLVKGDAGKVQILSYPTQIRHGLVWAYMGNPEDASKSTIPSVERLEKGGYEYSIVDERFDAHFSLVVENFCDLYHEHLHRKYTPFTRSSLDEFTREGDTIRIQYDTDFASGLLLKYFLPDIQPRTKVLLTYTYPHLSLHFEDKYQLWIFFSPTGTQTTRVFAYFLSKFQVPFLGMQMPRLAEKVIASTFAAVYSRTFTHEDRVILAHEQKMQKNYADKPAYEFNPVVPALRELLLEKAGQT